jgi:hypothetical protein
MNKFLVIFQEDQNAIKFCSLMGAFERTNFTLCNTHGAMAAIEDILVVIPS